MSFTYTTLVNAVEEYTQNTNWGSTTQIGAIIKQAEERINYIIQIQNFNTKTLSSTGGITAGDSEASISESEVAPLSPLYFRIRTTGDTNAWTYLLLKDYNFLQEYAPIEASASRSRPKYYSFYNNADASTPTNAATFSFSPIADGTYDYNILYYFEPPSIVSDTDGTWLSTHATNALLYGCLIEAYTFMKGDADLVQLYDTKFKESLQTLVRVEGGDYRAETYKKRGAGST